MSVTIDLITYDPKRDAFILVAVAEGPWLPDAVDEELGRLERKLLHYVEVAVGGALAERYPDSVGKLVIIRLDSYDTPAEQTEQLFYRTAECIHSSHAVQASISNMRCVAGLDFELNQRSLDRDASPETENPEGGH